MSDNYYCADAKEKFLSAKEKFGPLKSAKEHLEAVLKAAGEKEQSHETERNDIVIRLRAKEEKIREARNEGKSDDSLEDDRNRIVTELRTLEEKLNGTREYIKEKKAEHYETSGKVRKLYDYMIEAASAVRTNCQGNAGSWDIDLSIPSFE